MKKAFILYDGRAKLSDPENAAVYVCAGSEAEALFDGQDDAWQDGIWYEYDVIDGTLVSGKPRWDLPPANSNL